MRRTRVLGFMLLALAACGDTGGLLIVEHMDTDTDPDDCTPLADAGADSASDACNEE